VRGIYNRAQLWDVRRAMMQHWADRIDRMRRGGADVIPMKKRGAA
jgi:hypothetical protein